MKRHLVTGLAILLPLIMTLWIVNFAVDLLTDPFLGITEEILSAIGCTNISFLFISAEHVRRVVSQFLILVFLGGFIIGIGAVARYFFFKYILKVSDAILHRIPIISSVYKTFQELIQTIFTSDNKAFKQVVLVPFPHGTSRSLGFLTRDDITQEKIPVFIPTAPNPTSGFLVLFDAKDITPIEMSVETAFRYIVSCGVLISSDLGENGFTPLTSKNDALALKIN